MINGKMPNNLITEKILSQIYIKTPPFFLKKKKKAIRPSDTMNSPPSIFSFFFLIICTKASVKDFYYYYCYQIIPNDFFLVSGILCFVHEKTNAKIQGY